jgi:hypothetical protein
LFLLFFFTFSPRSGDVLLIGKFKAFFDRILGQVSLLCNFNKKIMLQRNFLAGSYPETPVLSKLAPTSHPTSLLLAHQALALFVRFLRIQPFLVGYLSLAVSLLGGES